MKGVLLFLLMVIAAVFCGLVIAYFYLRRLADDSYSVRGKPRAVPFPAKHPPVDVTPSTVLPELPVHRVVAAGMPRLPDKEAQQEQRPASERDDLKRIKGIGPKLEQTLNANGIFNFQQIADWQVADIQAMDKLLPAFHGRIQREDWVGQARRLRGNEQTANGALSA